MTRLLHRIEFRAFDGIADGCTIPEGVLCSLHPLHHLNATPAMCVITVRPVAFHFPLRHGRHVGSRMRLHIIILYTFHYVYVPPLPFTKKASTLLRHFFITIPTVVIYKHRDLL